MLHFLHVENGDNNSVSLLGQGSFMGMRPVTLHSPGTQNVALHWVFTALWSQLSLCFVLEADGTGRHALRASRLGSHAVLSAPASLVSGRGLVYPFSCVLCLPLPPVGPGLGGQGVGLASGSWAWCQGQERPGHL